MSSKIHNFVDKSFKMLVDDFGFRKITELDDGQSYNVKFRSDGVGIEIEKYFRELYVYVFRMDDPDGSVSIYNLLSYLTPQPADAPSPNYFKEEHNLDECFRKQAEHISQTILTNLEAITSFFNSGKYQEERIKLHEYLKNKNPQLYDTI